MTKPMLTRLPCPALRPFVQRVWAREGERLPGSRPRLERVLPTGCAHVVFRLSDDPVVVYGEDGTSPGSIGHAVVGGARSRFYVRDAAPGASSVGALLQPGAAALLLGVPADELAERHTPLSALWHSAAEEVRQRLAEAPTLEARRDRLESVLLERLPRLRAMHPAVAHALERFTSTDTVRLVVKESGYSHRRFGALFREHVGLAPKVFCRVRRLSAVLELVAEGPIGSWAEVALAGGFWDQAHFGREFRRVAGVAPGGYRRGERLSPHHVRLPG
jgi:AraC-like DNA-binding protein